jgi:hypothetical protein
MAHQNMVLARKDNDYQIVFMNSDDLKYVLSAFVDRPLPECYPRQLVLPCDGGKVVGLSGSRRCGKTFVFFETMLLEHPAREQETFDQWLMRPHQSLERRVIGQGCRRDAGGFAVLDGADQAEVGEGAYQIESGRGHEHLPVREVVCAEDFEGAGGEPPCTVPDGAIAGTHEFAVALADVGHGEFAGGWAGHAHERLAQDETANGDGQRPDGSLAEFGKTHDG